MLVSICDLDVATILLQINSLHFSKDVVISGEGHIQTKVINRIVNDVAQTLVNFSINTLHVLQSDLLPQHHFVECSDKEGVEETPVEDCKTNHTTNELEVVKMFGVDTGVRVDLQSVVIVRGVFKQTVEGVEHLVRQQVEELSVERLVHRLNLAPYKKKYLDTPP